MMDRRRFLGVAIVAAAVKIAEAQAQGGKLRQVGYLSTTPGGHPLDSLFTETLRDLGWIDGRTMVFHERYSAGNNERFAGWAADFARIPVDVIAGWSPSAVGAARSVTSSIPIVGLSLGDPVRVGWAASFARPGGNVTGLGSTARGEIAGKSLEFLKQVVPNVVRLAILLNPMNPDRHDDAAAKSARALGLQPQVFEVSDPTGFDKAFAEMKARGVGALFVMADGMLWARREDIVRLSIAQRLPGMYWSGEYTTIGGLMSYAPDLAEMARRGAVYVDRILKGARPGDLPIEEPSKFDLAINLKTARALGLTIPPSLLLQAKQVID